MCQCALGGSAFAVGHGLSSGLLCMGKIGGFTDHGLEGERSAIAACDERTPRPQPAPKKGACGQAGFPSGFVKPWINTQADAKMKDSLTMLSEIHKWARF